MDLAVHRRRHMSFATVISVTTKQVVKLLGIPEGKYSQTFQSRLGDKYYPYTDVQVNKMPEKELKISGSNTFLSLIV
jgi:protoheme ferro-lyase